VDLLDLKQVQLDRRLAADSAGEEALPRLRRGDPRRTTPSE